MSEGVGEQAAGIVRVNLCDAAAQPWRNGGGVTRELLAWPCRVPGSPEGWAVRVSVADIDADGPFSAFAGVARGFAVLEGAGVLLGLQAGERSLTPADEVLLFDGAEAPGCRLIGGPTRDLNLMVRRGDGQLRMRRAAAGDTWGEAMSWRGLYTHGPACVETAEGRLELGGGTLIWSDEARAAVWQLASGTQAWWLGCTPGSRT